MPQRIRKEPQVRPEPKAAAVFTVPVNPLLLCQLLDVPLVSGAWRSPLVPHEIIETYESHLNATVGPSDNVGSRLLIGDAVDVVDQIDSGRDDAEGQDVAARGS